MYLHAVSTFAANCDLFIHTYYLLRFAFALLFLVSAFVHFCEQQLICCTRRRLTKGKFSFHSICLNFSFTRIDIICATFEPSAHRLIIFVLHTIPCSFILIVLYTPHPFVCLYLQRCIRRDRLVITARQRIPQVCLPCVCHILCYYFCCSYTQS